MLPRDTPYAAPESPPPGETASRAAARRRTGNNPLGGLALALQFLTILPVSAPTSSAGRSDGPPAMARALPWFPLVGAGLGGVAALVDGLLRPVFSIEVRSVLVLALLAGLTGLLHLDGFIDCCDGLLGTRALDRRLDILRDSRVGAYGVVGGALLVLLEYAALVAIVPADWRAVALIVALLLARWSMVYAVVRYPYARSSGVGSPFRATVRHLAWATLATLVLFGVVALALSVIVGSTALPAVLAWVGLLACAALLLTAVTSAWMSGRLGGGLTGDTYGALSECVEVGTLVLVPVLAMALHIPAR